MKKKLSNNRERTPMDVYKKIQETANMGIPAFTLASVRSLTLGVNSLTHFVSSFK